MTYDPLAHGAQCHRCPLAQGGQPQSPVGPEEHRGATIALVGEAPGRREVETGRPFVGPSGIEEMKALRKVGWDRPDFHWTNTICCRPPGNGDLNLYMMQLKSRNRRRKRKGQEPLPSPQECCKPRLDAELAGFRHILSLGSAAAKAVVPGLRTGVLDIRGGPVEREDGVKILPTLHPAFVLRAPRWRQAFLIDHARAVRWFQDRLSWVDPQVLYKPTVSQLAEFLGVGWNGQDWVAVSGQERPLAWDYETDGIESLDCKVRCLGIGTASQALVIPFLGIDGRSRFYPPVAQQQIERILRAWMVGPGLKIGHNSGYYDTLVAEQHLGVTPTPQLDTILMHRLVEAELPHSLAYLGSTRTDVMAWKAGKEATEASTDYDLWLYNARDVAVTARVAVPLAQQVQRRGLGEITTQAAPGGLLGTDHEIQRICCVMHRNGMRIDQDRREVFLHEYEARLRRWRTAAMEAPQGLRSVWRREGRKEHPFNPNSGPQVGRLIYEDWDIEPEVFTDGGDPSVSDVALRKLLADPTLPREQRDFIRALRQYRKASKVVSTYLLPAGPPQPGQRPGRLKGDYKGWLRPNGRVHADWKAHTVVTGRLGSSPNMQNVPIKLRSMFIPESGRRFVYADADQLELRIAAARWGAARYMEAFEQDQDPHQTTMNMIFGDEMWGWDGAPPREYRYKKKWPGGKIAGHFSDCRDLAKRVQYASQYGAATETVHDVITSAEDQSGELVYADLSVSEVRALHESWLEGCPEFKKGWDKEMAYFHKHKFVREEVAGRVRDCLDGDELNTVVNFPIQATGASIINVATIEVEAMFPSEYAGQYTGLVNQCHDALTLEVPEKDAERCRAALQAAMSGTTSALPGVDFKAEAAVKLRWED